MIRQLFLLLVFLTGTLLQPQCAHAAPKAIEFRNVMLIRRSYNIPGYRTGTVPEAEIAAIRTAFEVTLPKMISDWSGKTVRWKNQVIVSDRVLRTTGGGGNPAQGGAEWITPRDIQEDLQEHVSWGEYDCIYVYLGYPMDSAGGYGGGGPLGAGLVTTPQILGAGLAYNSESMGGLFHEWCHAVAEDFYRDTLGIPTVPGIHHEVPDPTWVSDDYGYNSGGKPHWLNWYINYLQGTVRSRNGKTWGLGERAWRARTRREYYNPPQVGPKLLKQASFEENPPSLWRVASWRGNEEAGRITTDGARAGRRAAVLEVTGAGDDVSFLQRVRVKPNTRYHLSGWIRTAGVQVVQEGGATGANLSITGGWEQSDSLVGGQPWTQVHLLFDSGDRTEVEIAARLGFYSSLCIGTAWFDDLKLVELGRGRRAAASPQR
jgi:hypothetical protein